MVMVYGLGAHEVTPVSNVLLIMLMFYGIFIPMFPYFSLYVFYETNLGLNTFYLGSLLDFDTNIYALLIKMF